MTRFLISTASLVLTVFLTVTAVTVHGQTDNKSLLVGTWKQFAYKPNNSTEIKKITEDCSSKTMTFREDGHYEEEMYCLKSTGKWYFNNDQTKFDFTLETFNGMAIPAFSDTTKRTNKLIIKLSQDTLIYGMEAYYGNERIYGHDDSYFVRTAPQAQSLKTAKYAGKYSYGHGEGSNDYGGSIILYPETDTTVLFFIDIYSGNLGQKYSRLIVKNGKGIFANNQDGCCKWQIIFEPNKLTISTLDKCYDCGFGGTIFADHEYKRVDSKTPLYFIDGHGHKIYFNETSPENYLK